MPPATHPARPTSRAAFMARLDIHRVTGAFWASTPPIRDARATGNATLPRVAETSEGWPGVSELRVVVGMRVFGGGRGVTC